MEDDLDIEDRVAQVIANAEFDGKPVTYATGTSADRRVSQQFRALGLTMPKDRLCGGINRLCDGGVVVRRPAGPDTRVVELYLAELPEF